MKGQRMSRRMRYLLTAAIIVMMIFSLSIGAAASNDLNANFYDSDGSYLDTQYGSAEVTSAGILRYDVKVSVTTAAAPTKAGYTFNGWKIVSPESLWNKVVSGTLYDAVSPVLLHEVLNIYHSGTPSWTQLRAAGHINADFISFQAVYTANQYDVTLYSDNVLFSQYTNQSYGSLVNGTDGLAVPDPALKPGYVFLGWQDSYGVVYSPNSAGKILYALNNAAPTRLDAVWAIDSSFLVLFKNAETGVLYGYFPSVLGVSGNAPLSPFKLGYTFVSWVNEADSLDTLASGQPFTINSNKTYKAVWEAIDYAITSTASNASVAIDGGINTANVGDVVKFTATADSNYFLSQVSVVNTDNGTNVLLTDDGSGNYSFEMPAAAVNINVTAKSNLYDITTHGFNATITADGTANAGVTVTFNVVADSTYILDQVSVTNLATNTDVQLTNNGGGSYSFVMPESNVTINATAKQGVYNITPNPNHTTITADSSASVGATVTFDVVADSTYILDQVSVTNEATNTDVQLTNNGGGNYSFVMPESNVTINATAKQGVYNITPNPNHTTITADSSASVGATVTFDVVADSTYILDQVSVTNEATNTDVQLTNNGGGNYSFVMPESNVTINATAKQGVYNILKNGTNATITAAASAGIGEYVPFTVTPQDPNHVVSDVYVETNNTNQRLSLIVTSNGYAFAMPEEDVTIYATCQAADKTVIIVDWDNTLLGVETLNGQVFDISSYTNLPPERDGFVFWAWKNTNNNQQFIPSLQGNDIPVNENYTVLKAVYKGNAHNVTKAADCSEELDLLNVLSYNTDGSQTSASLLGSGQYCISSTGADVRITVKPKLNYTIEPGVAVRGVGGSITAIQTNLVSYNPTTGEYVYSFTMPDEEVEVSVYTKAVEYTVSVLELENPEGGTYTINGHYTNNFDVAQGETATIDVMPEPGYIISYVSAYYTNPYGGGTSYLIDRVAYPTGTSFDFVMPGADVTVELKYEKIEYAIDTATSNAATVGQGMVTAVPSPTATVGDTVKLTVTPEYGYNLNTLVVTGDVSGKALTLSVLDALTYEFAMPAEDVTVTATFVKNQYTVVFRDHNGTVLDQQPVKYRENPVMPADPDNRVGYDFLGWVSNDTDPSVTVPSVLDTDFTIVKNTVITAVYAQHNYTISYNVPLNGTIDPKDTDANFSDTARFTVTPDAGYQIDKVTASYVDTLGVKRSIEFNEVPASLIVGGEYAFTMPDGNVEVNVSFKEITYNVNVTAVTGDGEVYLNGYLRDNMQADYGETVKIMVSPDPGWKLDSLTVTEATSGNEVSLTTINASMGIYSFVMPKDDVEIEVVFVQKTYTVSYDQPLVNGKVNASTTPASETVAYQSMTSFDVVPDEGYQIASVEATYTDTKGVKQTVTFTNVPSDIKVGGTYSFVMPAGDVTVNVLFEEITYNVDLNVTGNARVLLNDVDQESTTAKNGATVTLEITPDTGYKLTSITVTGIVSGNDYTVAPAIDATGGTYSFTMPAEDVDVDVVLELKEGTIGSHSISFHGTDHGDININVNGVNNATIAKYGEQVIVEIDPNDGYRFKSISVKNMSTGEFINTAYVEGLENYVEVYSFVMPDGNVEIRVAFELYAPTRYTDVRTDHWAYEAVEFVSDRGYFNGMTPTLFMPKEPMNRAMFVTVLGRIDKVDTNYYTTSSFTDVEINKYFSPYVQWAAEEEIVKGYGKGLFGPFDNIKREQMAQIMYNYAIYGGYPINLDNADWINNYRDADQISSYAKDAMTWAVSNGLMHGVNKNNPTLAPQGIATRAEVAQIIKNYCDKVINR
ncbi:MAG: InlB B-repeat-containing protein [Bacillota bacterium]